MFQCLVQYVRNRVQGMNESVAICVSIVNDSSAPTANPEAPSPPFQSTLPDTTQLGIPINDQVLIS